MSKLDFCEKNGFPADTFISLVAGESHEMQLAEIQEPILPIRKPNLLDYLAVSFLPIELLSGSTPEHQLARECARAVLSGECQLFGIGTGRNFSEIEGQIEGEI